MVRDELSPSARVAQVEIQYYSGSNPDQILLEWIQHPPCRIVWKILTKKQRLVVGRAIVVHNWHGGLSQQSVDVKARVEA